MVTESPKIVARDFSIMFGTLQALRDVSLDIRAHEILGIIGPANSGKTSFLRALNRMNELHPLYRYTGTIHLETEDTAIFTLPSDRISIRVGLVPALA